MVTGGSSGIGRAIAVRCAAEGARVLAVGRDEEEMAERAATGSAMSTRTAPTWPTPAPPSGVAHAVSGLGGLDGLVHAAGIVRRGRTSAARPTTSGWRMRDINLTDVPAGPGACGRWSRRSGSVVLVGSQLAQVGAPGYASYCAVKGAVEALVRALAVDFGPSGIRVNSLTPGLVQTPLAYVDRPDFDDQIETIAARLPLRRIGQPDDMAGPAVFLLSDDSAWMTGQSLVVDGGYTVQ